MAATATATLNLKLPPEEKESFIEACAALGTTPSNAVRMFVSAFNRQGGFPFDLSNPYGYNQETVQAIEDTAARRNLSRPFSTVDEMFDEIGV